MKRKISIRLSKECLNELDALSVGRFSRSVLIEAAIVEYVARWRRKPQVMESHRQKPLDPVFGAMDAASETLRTMTTNEGVALAVRAGILTPEGKLTEPYRQSTPRTNRAKVACSRPTSAGGRVRVERHKG